MRPSMPTTVRLQATSAKHVAKSLNRVNICSHTDKKENQFFPIYKEIQSEAIANSYMRKGFQIYEEMLIYFPIYKEPLVIYDFATAPS
jgi:hypothetical protein